MISVITPTHNTPADVLARTFASIKTQTHQDWEWVIWDDSTTDDVWRQVYGFCSDERFRIRLFRGHVPSGVIGDVKRNGFMVANGDILVELDHDDELMPTCLAEIEAAFTDSAVGFVYSDWCEILPDGSSGRYPDGWGFGFGSHYWSDGVWVMGAPAINRVTMNHIVSAPNHVRAWKASVYRGLGGHNAALPVADDYELCVRTSLVTEMRHIPKMLYRQHIGSHTAQRKRNAEIQRQVGIISGNYADALNERFGRLDV